MSDPGDASHPPPDIAAEPAAAARPAAAPRTRQRLSQKTRRRLLILVGLLTMALSVTGFVLAADALDERRAVLVAAVDIDRGAVIETSHLTGALASLGDIPHVAWSPDIAASYAGTIARTRIPAGSLVTADDIEILGSHGDEILLLLEVPLDTSLTNEVVHDGDSVLLIDPGVDSAQGVPGRPRRVIRQFVVENFDGSQMTLHLPPPEHLQWSTDLVVAGGYLLAVPLPSDADPEASAAELDAVWQQEHDDRVEALSASALLAAGPQAGVGEIEIRIALDTHLAPSGVNEGDLVLLVDPGLAPSTGDPGRPRTVLQPLLLEHFQAGVLTVFASPEEWVRWQSLIDDLGGTALVLPVPAGTDADDMSERLDAAWLEEWQDARAAAQSAEASGASSG